MLSDRDREDCVSEGYQASNKRGEERTSCRIETARIVLASGNKPAISGGKNAPAVGLRPRGLRSSGKKPCTWRWKPPSGGAACILDVQGDW